MTNGEFECITCINVTPSNDFLWHKKVSSTVKADLKYVSEVSCCIIFFFFGFSDASTQILIQEYILTNVNVHLKIKDSSVFLIPQTKALAYGCSQQTCPGATGTQTALRACLTSRTFLTVAP